MTNLTVLVHAFNNGDESYISDLASTIEEIPEGERLFVYNVDNFGDFDYDGRKEYAWDGAVTDIVASEILCFASTVRLVGGVLSRCVKNFIYSLLDHLHDAERTSITFIIDPNLIYEQKKATETAADEEQIDLESDADGFFRLSNAEKENLSTDCLLSNLDFSKYAFRKQLEKKGQIYLLTFSKGD